MTTEEIATEVLVDGELEKRLIPDKKTILYVGIRYDYGHADWGLSYEHYNFYRTFLGMGYSLIYYDYDRLYQKYGKEKMSEMLLESVYYYNPDILFYFNFHDWIEHDVWRMISECFQTKTVIWLGDDQWRYEETKPIWSLFNVIITVDKNGYEKRKGDYNVILSQWGCNQQLYRKLNLLKIYDISFIGRCYGERKEFIESLTKQGIPIKVFGQGWDGTSGRISQADMIRIYNQSKIVLNMSITSKDEKIQVKGRDFEVPGCGSLLLTKDSDEIKEYFVPLKEIITYENADDAAEIIRFYLKNDLLRQQVTNNGYDRVMRDHTYEKRFNELFISIFT